MKFSTKKGHFCFYPYLLFIFPFWLWSSTILSPLELNIKVFHFTHYQWMRFEECSLKCLCVSLGGTWCVCKEGLSEAMLQKTLDYACGAGADCGPIHQTGPCFNPNTVKSHCSYAVNSFFQKKGQSLGTCDFAGTATFSASDPSESLLPTSLH